MTTGQAVREARGGDAGERTWSCSTPGATRSCGAASGPTWRADGKTVTMSLSGTCMSCHPNKKEFCDACHDYLAVSPYCWDCHVEPKEKS